MENINAIMVINNNVIEVEDFTVREMTHEDYIECIKQMRHEMMQLQNQYNALVRLTNVINRQRNKYIVEKLQSNYSRRLFAGK